MTKRQVFFSFEYMKDNWRAAEVRNMGVVSGESTFSDNDWETVKCKTDAEIKKWIDSELAMRSCLVVLIGATTSTRKWVRYEIQKAYELDKGIVGIYIHNLKDSKGNQAEKGNNPFYNLFTYNNKRLSDFVICYDSVYSTSKFVYDNIKENIGRLIEDAIGVAGTY